MTFALALLIAANFWHARHVEVPCHPVAVHTDVGVPVDVYGLAAPMSALRDACTIVISSQAEFYREAGPEWYCSDVTHELGHIAGLQHTRTGIMGAYTGRQDIPWDCLQWKSVRRGLAHR